MVGFTEGLKNGIRSAYCSGVSGTPTWFSNLRSVLIPAGLREQGDNLNRWICGSNPDPIELPGVPFIGGQCPGATYSVTFTSASLQRKACTGGTNFTDDLTVPKVVSGLTGPITSIDVVAGGTTQFCSFTGTTIPTGAVARIVHAGGTSSSTFLGASNSATIESSTFSVTITRTDGGGTDNCGDPPPNLPPPGDINVDVDIDYDDDGGNPVSITVPAIFAPVYVALDGTLRIPISIGEINFKGEINLNGDFEISPNFEVNFSEEGQSDDPDLPDTDRPGDIPPVDPLGPDAKIIGVHVRASPTGNVRASAILQDNGPTITAPRCANVVFGIRIGSLFGWTSDIPVKNLQSYIHCPVPEGAHDVRVTPEPGYDVSMTPVRGKPANPPD